MKNFKTAILLVLLSFNAVASDVIVDSHPAEKIVRETTEKALAILKKQPDAQHVRQLISDVILPKFNIKQMSKWALGKEWEKLNEDKQAVFISHFQQLLVNTYATTLTKFENQAIHVQQAKLGKNRNIVLVPTIVSLKNARPMQINYTMMNGNNDWQVVDISISGVGLIRNYRATYASAIQKDGFDALMKRIIRKNELAGL